MKRLFASALALALLGACTTSFDIDQLAAVTDATVSTKDAALDARDATRPDAPVDGSASCGAMNAPCCSSGSAPSSCNPGLVCSSGVCAQCPGSLLACDGFCVDSTSNASHCGACGHACADGQACVGGSCVLSCAPGLTVCSNDCVQTLSDPMHCGRCGRACGSAHTTGSCAMGVCAPGRCETGFGDCDATVSNGCETSLNDSLAHCGACGNACALPHAAAMTCVMGACRVGMCEPDYLDCDMDPANGCEVDRRTNAAHCGTCTTTCSGGTCNGGMCRTSMTMCSGGMADCRADVSGCDTNITSDVANCGACGNACALTNATPQCVASTCAVASCNAGFADCDMTASNGCETSTLTSLAHCGGCGMACAPMHATGVCLDGRCGFTTCDDGWGDCDGNPANGCETDLGTSAANCGACRSACSAQNATPLCAAGRCAVGACSAGFADCDSNPANGCEAATLTSTSNCGACGNVCAFSNASASCVAGACALAACNAGFADCDMSAASGCESNTQTDPAHCGACATACAIAHGMPACVGGRCAVASCNEGFADCDNNPANGCEVDLASSGSNCGRCGSACSAVQQCSSGACRNGCAPGLTVCGSSCVDLRTSVSNCGSCGRVCPTPPNSSSTCNGGACSFACNANFANCDSNATNGCESDLRSSPRTCGSCSRVCPSGVNSTAFCAMGACGLSCSSNFANCDGNASNGCEVNITTVFNCGRCGNRCELPHAGNACTSGMCTIASCGLGFANCNGVTSDGCETGLGNDNRNCGSCGHVCGERLTCRLGFCVL